MKNPAWFIIMILVSAVVVLTVMLVAKPTQLSYTKSDMIASLEADGYWVLAGGSREVPGDLIPSLDNTYYLGSSVKSWKGLRLPNTYLFDNSTALFIRNDTDTSYMDLYARGVFTSENVTLPNTKSLRIQDPGGTARNAISMDGDGIFQIGDSSIPNIWGFEAAGIQINGHLGVMRAPDEDNGAAGIWYQETIHLPSDNHYRNGIQSGITAYKTVAAFDDQVAAVIGSAYIGALNTKNWTGSLYSGPALGAFGGEVFTESGSTGTLTWAAAYFGMGHFYGMTTTKFDGLHIANPNGNAGFLLNNHAIYVAPQTFGNVNYAIYVEPSALANVGTSFFGTGTIVPNNVSYGAQDSTGAGRSLMRLDSSDVLQILGLSDGSITLGVSGSLGNLTSNYHMGIMTPSTLDTVFTSTDNFTLLDNTDRYGAVIAAKVAKTSAAYTGTAYGASIPLFINDSNTQDWTNAAEGAVGASINIFSVAGSSGNVTWAKAIRAYANFPGATADSYAGLYVENPQGTIDKNYAIYIADQTTGAATNYSIYSAGGLNYFAGHLGINTTKQYGSQLDIKTPDNSTAMAIQIDATQAKVDAKDTFIDFRSTTGSEGSITGTGSAGIIAYNTFTGSHYTQVMDKTGLEVGMLVEIVDEDVYGFAESASFKPQLFKTKISSTRGSKAAIGAYGGTDKEGRDMVFSLGTGFMWVTNTGHNIEVGDWLMASDVPGHAELHNGSTKDNAVVAKATTNVVWNAGETRRLIKVIYQGG